MPIAFFLILLLIVILILWLVIGLAWTGFLLTFASLLLTIPFRRLNVFLERYAQSIKKTSVFGAFAKTLISLPPRIIYFDLSLIILAIMLVVVSFNDSLTSVLANLVDKGFVSFPDDKDGLTQLQLYMAGYIFIPTFVIGLGLYGFSNGFQLRKIFFRKLIYSISFGLLLSIVLISISRGKWTGLENLRRVQRADNVQLPVGAEYVIPFLFLGFLLFLIFALSGYVLLFSFLGRKVEKLLSKTQELKAGEKNGLDMNQESGLDMNQESQ